MTSLIACATGTHKINKPNQDYCLLFENLSIQCKGVIIADGIGSHSLSEISSKFCVERLKEKIENIQTLPLNYSDLFSEVKKELEQYVKQASVEDTGTSLLGTTLLCAVELPDAYQVAYVGNGSIWQVSGNFNHFGPSRDWPWNAINLLNPHNIEEKGTSVLYKYISIGDVPCNPSIVTLSKNEDAYGDILIVATDGVYTSDDAKIGKDGAGVIWEMAEPAMLELFKILNDEFSMNPSEISSVDMGDALKRYLSLLLQKGIMDDDTTLGIILSTRALEYQFERWQNNKSVNEKGEPISKAEDSTNIASSNNNSDETNSGS